MDLGSWLGIRREVEEADRGNMGGRTTNEARGSGHGRKFVRLTRRVRDTRSRVVQDKGVVAGASCTGCCWMEYTEKEYSQGETKCEEGPAYISLITQDESY